MALGIIFGETSTREFSFLFGDAGGERQNQLKFAYVEADLKEDGSRVVARVIDMNTENPLLAKDTAKFYSEHETTGIPFPDLISHRFTLYQAKCEVIGIYDSTTKTIDPLTQPIKPGEQVELLSEEVLKELFSQNDPWYLSLGYVETPGKQTQAQVSLKADSIVTMHASVFGMTGMGKTTTTAVILEELMFRGQKIIVFDPHGDYVNLGQIRRDLYNSFESRIGNDRDLVKKLSDYENYLSQELTTLNKFFPKQMKKELMVENIFYRLFNLCLIKNRHLMVDSTPVPEQLLDSVIDGIKQLDWQNHLPQGLANRMLALNRDVFPKIKMYLDKSPYFTMRLIEAMAREGFTDPQVGYIIRWLRGLSETQRNELQDVSLLKHLMQKVKVLSAGNQSKDALDRKLNRAKQTVEDLEKRDCKSIDIRNFVNAFCSKEGELSNVSTVIFNLSNLENNHVRRSLMYAIMEFAFDQYKSKHFIMEENAHPVLFAIEEARTLIPREEESSTSGEIHPATRAARLATRQIATEGRKMGLGLLVISQKPASVDPLTVSQANTLVLHRAINPDDQTYIRRVGESLSEDDLETLKTVKEGVAIITGDALKTRMSTLVKVRNRYSEPGTDRPRPIEKLWRGNS